MSAKKGLGRGFSSLIPTELLDETFDPTATQDGQLSQLKELPLADIDPDPDQPRRHFDELALDEMADSVREHGVIQPIVVTAKGSRYLIVAGERRYRASQRAGLTTIPALVRTMSDQHKLEVSLIENLQRRDLNILETATAYLKLRDQFNLTLDEIGARVGGKSVSAISNTLRLLRLPENVRQALHEGKMTEGQARPLINADLDTINAVLPQILTEDWSARRIEQYIVNLKNAKARQKQATPTTSQHDTAAEGLSKRFHTKIHIRSNTRGSGQIVISFKNEAEFERINKLLS
jgi:ParB family transcriptional regulator, chromosome partitioning protein